VYKKQVITSSSPAGMSLLNTNPLVLVCGAKRRP
jgi:hypothetical protein